MSQSAQKAFSEIIPDYNPILECRFSADKAIQCFNCLELNNASTTVWCVFVKEVERRATDGKKREK